MLYNILDMTVEGSVGTPTLTTYIIDDAEMFMVRERPMVIICPGGGYNHLSDREGELLALQYLAMGCHAAVLRYSVSPAVYPTPLLELAKAMATVRKNVKQWHIDPDKILVQGSSAGGHLAASLGVFWKKEWLWKCVGAESAEEIRPNGMILSYPVITSGEYAHRGSFDNLLGKSGGEKAEKTGAEKTCSDTTQAEEVLLEKLSLEKQVTADTPPAFIWHTFTDDTVPVENALFFVSALRKYNIPTEFHMYVKGVHGLALATEQTASAGGSHMQPECASWTELAHTWLTSV